MADECFSGHIVRRLHDAGLDVILSADICPAGTDAQVLTLAFSENRILLTEDTDFGDLVVRFGLPTRGIVRVDLKPMSREMRAKRTLDALIQLGESVNDAIVLIEPSRTRVRKLFTL